MNLKEFDSTEPVCKFGPGGDFTVPYPPKDDLQFVWQTTTDKITYVTLLASTKGNHTRIVLTLPFLMTREELKKLSGVLGEATREVSTKYLGPSVKDILIDL